MSATESVLKKYEEFLDVCQKTMPKVDLQLILELIRRTKEEKRMPRFALEVFTKSGTDPEKARQYIFTKTGMVPAVFDNGTHYVTNQQLSLDMLKEISDSEDVESVEGTYIGYASGTGAMHEHRH